MSIKRTAQLVKGILFELEFMPLCRLPRLHRERHFEAHRILD